MIILFVTSVLFTLAVIEELKATRKFELMDMRVDEAEHSMEMHLPYLAKIFEGYFLVYRSLYNILQTYSSK